MKVLLIGATGFVGRCVAKKVLAEGAVHSVTLFVRDQEKLADVLGDASLLRGVTIIEGDVSDKAALAAAFKGQEACICTAGNAKTSPEKFRSIFTAVVEAASENMVGGKRLWMMAGATILSPPGSDGRLTINDLPIFAWLPFKVHTFNYELLRATHGLDWSLMCPGNLHAATEADAHTQTRVFTEQAALWLPDWLVEYWPLRLLASLVMLPQIMTKFSVTVETVVDVMVRNLQAGGAYAGKRVGIGKV